MQLICIYRGRTAHLSRLAVDDKASQDTLARLAFKHTDATISAVAKINALHGYSVYHKSTFRSLKRICMMEGEEWAGLKDCI